MKINSTALITGVCGGVIGIANAAPVVVTGAGATLQEKFFDSVASTNDYIDVDGDGLSGSHGTFLPDQLAVDGNISNANNEWFVHYRVSGSGNGIKDLDFWNGVFSTLPDLSDTDGDGDVDTKDPGNSLFCDRAFMNYNDHVNGGTPVSPPYVGAHLSGAPYLPNMTTFEAELVSSGTSGFHVDMAASDVPVGWFIIQSGTPRFDAAPTHSGYGANPRLANASDGSAADQSNLLKILSRLNTDQISPDSMTIYSTPLALTPVAAIVNYGAGLQEITMSDLRMLAATGRRANGENLMKVTRDSGSGTRNAFMNGIGLDPSWGRGENIGEKTSDKDKEKLGPVFQPSNKGGSSRMEATCINHRLAVGHTGAERGVSKGWITGDKLDVLAVQSDLKGGTIFARPNQVNVIDGSTDGYNIVGPASLSHVGDPRNALPAQGGWGWLASETGATPYIDGMGNPNPAPANPGLSAYMNNWKRSLDAFISIPGGPDTDFMPGEKIAQLFLPFASPDYIPQDPPAGASQPIMIVSNPGLNTNVQTFVLGDPNANLNNPAYDAFDTATAGLVPTRLTSGGPFTDGNTSDHYVLQDATTIDYGDPLNMRNRIAYDFNGDGARTLADAGDMVAAWQDRNGGTAWIAGDASIEILGDGNGDGNFDTADVRYWADGLAMSAGGNLDRAAGFAAVDAAFGGNFFGTTLATGAYHDGDSRADVAGSGTSITKDANGQVTQILGATPGFAPTGADGTVDADDLDYICANFGDWSVLGEAVHMDLSCDMNGDLVVDLSDIETALGVMETVNGDLNLDGVADATDAAIVSGNMGMASPMWSDGDLNCDGNIDADDLAIINNCPADINGDGFLNLTDVTEFIDAFIAGDPIADMNGDGFLNLADVTEFVDAFVAGC